MLVSPSFAQGSVAPVVSKPLALVSGARTAGDEAQSRFVLDISNPLSFSVFALENPHRMVIDLPLVDFEMDQSIGQVERGLVSNFRFGTLGGSRSRIVLDLAKPAKVSRASSLPSVDGNPARLIVELSAVSPEEFTKQALREMVRVGADGKRRDAGAGQEAAQPVKVAQKPLVVLDPGHGGIDTGAVSKGGLVESKLVLNFARALKKRLEADGFVRVKMTRETDKFISLPGRVAYAQKHKADLFVSIHADSVRQNYVRGATVYTLSDKASDKISEALAKRENRADVLAGLEIEEKNDVVADILIDLTRRETSNHSTLYSRTLVGALKSSVRLAKNPQRSAGFRVLKAPDIPSVLLELGYLSNQKDQASLRSKVWQKKAIDSISLSMKRFFARRAAQSGGALPVNGLLKVAE